MNDLSSRPTAILATRLGHLALLPFVVGAALIWWVEWNMRPLASQALSAYAAVVVSFIGAIHWGLAFPQRDPAPSLLIWGVLPSLVAWPALLASPRIGLSTHAVMLVVCYLVDRRVYPRQNAAQWLPLRLRLTGIAAASCVVGALGA